MKKVSKTFFLLLLLGIIKLGFPQESSKMTPHYIRNQINVNIGRINDTKGVMNKEFFFGYMSVEALYGVNEWLETGVFCSWLRLKTGEILNNQGDLYYPLILNYGLATKAHLFPVIINPSFSLVDLYASAQVGTYAGTTGGEPGRESFCFRGISLKGSLGVGLNINRRFGLFYEYGYGILEGFNHRIGLNVRFGGPKRWQN